MRNGGWGVGRTARAVVAAAIAMASAIGAPVHSAGAAEPAAPTKVRSVDVPATKDLDAEADPDTLLAQPEPGDDIDEIARSHGLTKAKTLGHTGFVELRAPNHGAEQAKRALEADDRIQAVEPNYVRRAQHTPNDPLFDTYQDEMQLSRFPEAWDLVRDATNVTVAVIDSGVDLDHPDLAAQLVPGWDAIDGDATPQDANGHGTMTAGVVGARTNNGMGVAGGAYNTRIMPIRVLDAGGNGLDSDVVEGIQYAADHGADVIVMSLGGPGRSTPLDNAVAYARSKDVVVVAASGNHGGPQPMYPGATDGVVTVGAIDQTGSITYFSGHGAWLDLAAVGVDVTSTGLASGATESYATADGTSFSTPLVGAAAALVRARFPSWTAQQVIDRLTFSARDAGPPGHDESYGFGILDAFAAVGGTGNTPVTPTSDDAYEPNPLPQHAALLPLASNTATATATTAPEGDVDWFAVDVPTTGALSITLTPPTIGSTVPRGMDPMVAVHGPDGRLLGEVDAAGLGGTEELVVDVTAPGRHRIRVANYAGAISGGTYRITASVSDTPPAGFGPYEQHVVGAYGASTTIADVTGDGRHDAILTTESGNTPADRYSLFVFPQLADGTIGTPTRYAVGSTGSMALAHGDLDGDGDTDLAVSTINGIKVFAQLVSGALSSSPTTVSAGGEVAQAEVGDMDGDGRNDFVARTPAGTVIVPRTATGGWGTPTTVSTDGGVDMKVGDFSGDGRPDIAIATFDNVVTLVRQSAGGYARTVHPIAGSTGYGSNGVAIGDVNGDGRNDVALTSGGNRPTSTVNVYLQQSNGALAAAQAVPVYDIPQPIEAGDVNADGRTDLVLAHGGWMNVGTLPQRSDGTFAAEVLDPVPYTSHYYRTGLSLGQLDGVVGLDAALADNGGLTILRQHRSQPSGELPWVDSSQPLDDRPGIPVNSALSVTFGRPMNATSATSPSAVALRDGRTLAPVAATRVYDSGTRTLTLTPSSPLTPGVPYQVVVSGVQDSSGNTLDALDREVVRFRAAGDTPLAPPLGDPGPTPPTSTSTTTTSTTTTSTTAPPQTTTTFPTTPLPAPVGPPVPSSPPPARSGYWMVDASGAVYALGDAAWYGNAPVSGGTPAVDLEPTPSGNGYWIVDAAGHVYTFGDAPYRGGVVAPLEPGETATSLSRTASGNGYWIFTTKGRVVPFGDAAFLGDMSAVRLNGPVLDSIPTPSGNGYYMVASDGGIFTFGDAAFRGSMGGIHLNAPVQSLVPDGDGTGYWLVASDGGIFTFDAGFYGSMGAVRLNRPITGMVGGPAGAGYLMVAEDGGIFTFGTVQFHGSLGSNPPAQPVVSVARL